VAGFTFLVPAHPGSPGQRAVKRVCVLLSVVLINMSIIGHFNETVLTIFSQ